jgi:hypothetical protein
MRSDPSQDRSGRTAGCERIRTPDGSVWAVARAPAGVDGGVDLGWRLAAADGAEADPDIPWAWRWLGELADLAAAHPGWFTDLAVIPNGDPPQPLAEDSPFHGWLLVQVEEGGTDSVSLLELVPITGAEIVAQRTVGAAGLFDLLADAGVWGAPVRAWRAEVLPGAPAEASTEEAGLLTVAARAIASTRAAVAEHQRRMGSLELLRQRIHPPAWLTTEDEDPLHIVFADQWILRKHGSVLWGHIVEANDLLRTADREDHPATVAWSLDPWFDRAVDDLRRIASALADPELRRRRDGETARFARRLDEHVGRIMQWPVPTTLTGGRQVLLTSILVHRPHLPDGRLDASLLPLLLAPGRSQAAMILPMGEWTAELRDLWRALAR